MWICLSCGLRIRIFIMGSSANKTAKDEAPSNRPVSQSAYSEDEGLWEDVVQTSECCGCVRTKITRSTLSAIKKRLPGKTGSSGIAAK
jgi:hypothetical protein